MNKKQKKQRQRRKTIVKRRNVLRNNISPRLKKRANVQGKVGQVAQKQIEGILKEVA